VPVVTRVPPGGFFSLGVGSAGRWRENTHRKEKDDGARGHDGYSLCLR
jgi:hypothetical protein